MVLSDIRLQNFRSYGDSSFELSPRVNIIVGPNASGKTSLVEAIMVLGSGYSYRAKDAELIAFDQPWFRLDATTSDGMRTVKVIQQDTGVTKKQFIVQDQALQRLSLQRTIPIVLFEPDHLRLLSGSPERRRDYLDMILEQLIPGFATLRRQYKRTLAQRNRLLKQQAVREQIFAWNIRLSQLGGQIALERIKIVTAISQHIQAQYQELSHTQTIITARYTSRCLLEQYSSDMLHKLEHGLEQDIQRGFTSYGPHRDDLELYIHGHTLQSVASRGEVRTALLALKIVEIGLLESARNVAPLLLLDDVFSELDGARRKALTQALSGYQTFITTTDADVVVDYFLDTTHVIVME